MDILRLVPSSPLDLFAAAGVQHGGSSLWTEPLPKSCPGVYVVSLSSEPASSAGLPVAPLSLPVLSSWIGATGLTLHGTVPTPEELRDHLVRWWLPDEAVLYVGKAKSLSTRTRQYRRNDLGVDGRHTGGRWLKTLDGYKTTTVHRAAMSAPAAARRAEDEMLSAFEQRGSVTSRAGIPPSEPFLPSRTSSGTPRLRNG